MKAVGIIAEYNPFHKGHLKQIELIAGNLPDKPVIVVMSGNYVQRGEPAIFNKQVRVKAALLSGAAMVVELPVTFASASAEHFAFYAVSLLDSMGIVDTLCFGSEHGSLELLEEASHILSGESESFKSKLKEGLKLGMSFPRARHNAMSEILPGSNNLLTSPNNILGVEYLKALKNLNSPIKPYTIKRQGESYHSDNYEKILASAKAVRRAIYENKYIEAESSVPDNLWSLYEDEINSHRTYNADMLSPFLQYAVKTQNPDKLSQILDIDEGLENRIIKVCGEKKLISEILPLLKSKRYTYTKLSRALLHIILNISKEDFALFLKKPPHYLRVLGFRREYSFLFSEIEKKATAPIITNLKNAERSLTPTGIKMLEKEIYSTDIFNLMGLSAFPSKYEYIQPLVII